MNNKSLKSMSLSLLALGTLLLASCSSVPTQVDSGRIKARTFNFIAGKPPADKFAVDNREKVHVLIQQAITDSLGAKGVTRVASGGDVTVAYLVIVGNGAVTEEIDKYFGYGRDASALHDKAHEAYTDSKNPNYFEAGTLVVDIIDSRSFKLLHRSHVTRPVLNNPTAEVQAANIEGAVTAVLAGVRIAE
jgi:hypothetical protein